MKYPSSALSILMHSFIYICVSASVRVDFVLFCGLSERTHSHNMIDVCPYVQGAHLDKVSLLIESALMFQIILSLLFQGSCQTQGSLWSS